MPRSSGFLIQSTFGSIGNLEIVVPSARGGLVHCWRNHDAAGFPWVSTDYFGSGFLDGASLIQRFEGATPWDLEVLARVGGRLALFRREDGKWRQPTYIASGVAGRPALIQSRFGVNGNYEVVVPAAGGGLAYYRRRNDDPGRPWTPPVVFAENLGTVEGVALIQTDSGFPGTLELVAVVRDGAQSRLVHFWSDPPADTVWHGPAEVPLSGGAQPRGAPSLIQNPGSPGNFELVVPLAGGGLAHLTRLNDDPAVPWTEARLFAPGCTEASLIRSSFGNLEVVAGAGGQYQHFFFDEGAGVWAGPTAVAYQDPPLDLPSQGEWRVPYSCAVVGIHSALLHTGKVLFFTYRASEDQGRGSSCVLDPETGHESHLPDLEKDPFCGGHSFLADGRLLVAGGSGAGLSALHGFVPSGDSGEWQELPDMREPRWYPTCTTLPDGRVLITSGTKEGGTQPDASLNDTCQVFSPDAGLGELVQMEFLNEIAPVSIYPFIFVLPSGKLFVHGWNKTSFFDTGSMQMDAVRLLTVRPEPRNYPVQGTGVLLPLLPDSDPPYRPLIMLFGGGGVPPSTHMPATETCEILDLGEAEPRWRSAPPLSAPRVMPDAVLLPDATVLIVNGSAAGWAHDANTPVYAAEIYNPGTGAWSQACPERVPRLYHSTALLLPDGRVLTAGTDETYNIEPFHRSEYRLEMFSPPYLFRGPRPRFSSATGAVPEQLSYGEAFTVRTPDAAGVASVALLRPGAVTHSFNMDQRYVGLRITGRSTSDLTLETPPEAGIAPPGYYMLFLVNDAGVPSVARFVRLA